MFIDQSEIDSLLKQAGDLVDEVEDTAFAAPETAGPALSTAYLSEDVKRLLRIRVPVIVQLAVRHMPVTAIRRLSLGTIIQFEKSVDDPLDLLINNRWIGDGEAVKVNDHFGLRVAHIGAPADRINALGR